MRNQASHARSLGSMIQCPCKNDASGGASAPPPPPPAPANASAHREAALREAERDIHSPEATGRRAPVPPPDERWREGRRPRAYAAPVSARREEAPPAVWVGGSRDDRPDASEV